MFANPSLTTRIAVGKMIGFGFGLIGFFAMPLLWPEGDLSLRLGILLWYTTMGGIIGVFGVITRHPVLKLPLPWWIRAPFIGGWMNFVMVLFAHETMAKMLTYVFGVNGLLTSPFWFVLEGAIIGMVMGYFATRFGGEGRETVGA